MISFLRKLASENRFFSVLIFVGYWIYEKYRMLLFLFYRRYPIQENKIVFSAMQGERYGDNPYYVSEILRNMDKEYDLVWLLNPNVEDSIDKEIRRVDNRSTLAVIKELATAKVWVDSNMKHSGFLKRKGQLYVQTWHGSYGLKKIGLDLGKNLPPIDKRNFLYNAKREDLMVSNSKRTTEIYRRAFFYSGEIIEKGSPRNDMLLSNPYECETKVREYFNLCNQHIVLYAPTFRNDYKVDNMKLDFERLKQTLEKTRGGEWVVLIRLHYKNLEEASEFIPYSSSIMNASEYGVMQELLSVADILITDYSSCMFDFATTEKPCFIYASDLEKYNHERGNYFSMDELPFPLAENNEQLEKQIVEFDEVEYQSNLKSLFDKVGLNETGHASEAVATYIKNWMEKN